MHKQNSHLALIALMTFLVSQSSLASNLDSLLKKYEQPGSREPATTTKAVPALRPKKVSPAPKINVAPAVDPVAPAGSVDSSSKPNEGTTAEKKANEASATAEPESGAAEAEAPKGLLGDWGGAKSALSKRGLDLSIGYKSDYMSNVAGGLEKKSAFLGNVDIVGDFNFDTLVGVKGLSLVVYALGNHGAKPTEFVGDSFATSNIEAPDALKIYELHLRQNFGDETTAIFGLRDLNADFYAIDAASDLVNSAFGISPSFSQTGVNGPSIFPQTALALVLSHKSPSSFYFQAGIFNAQAGKPEEPQGTHIYTRNDEGYLYVWEAGVLRGEEEEGQLKISLGAWSYSKPQANIDSTLGEVANSGVYSMAQIPITPHLLVFAKYGTANESVNSFKASLETGIQVKGSLYGREYDALSVGYANANASDVARSLNAANESESVIEVGYRVGVCDGLSFTPGYQRIIGPSLGATPDDSQVVNLRTAIEF